MGSGARRAVVLTLLAGACIARSPYVCRLGDECVEDERQGVCEPTGFCAFPDDGCASGRRYGALAGATLASTCVEDASAEPMSRSDALAPEGESPPEIDAASAGPDPIDATIDVPIAVGPPDAPPCAGIGGVGQPCDGPDGDLCAEGVWTCTGDGAAVSCNDQSATNPEACNGVDDDCNGAIDDGPAATICGTSTDFCLGGVCYCSARFPCTTVCVQGVCGG